MKINVHNRCSDFDSYRAAAVKSLFNVESGANFDLTADLPIDDNGWQIGVVVGPSGSGKTSIGRQLGDIYAPAWPSDRPIVDAISPDGSFDAVTAALASVGLGSVPTWLRPYPVLSNGERFRADLARLVCDAPPFAVLDEFSSVVDRQIAKVGAGAFAKAWRRTGGKAVLLSCHYDILDWVQPDWVFDTENGRFERGRVRQRPKIELEIYPCKQADWRLFEPHHYLKLPPMVAATHYMGLVDGQPVAHIAFSTRPGLAEARACRLVVMPEWQGAGVGMRFLNACCEMWRRGENRYQKPLRTLFHTSHPIRRKACGNASLRRWACGCLSGFYSSPTYPRCRKMKHWRLGSLRLGAVSWRIGRISSGGNNPIRSQHFTDWLWIGVLKSVPQKNCGI